MPSLQINDLNQILNKFPEFRAKIFIETGTCGGETIFKMEPYFEKLYTIEIYPDLYNSTKSKYNGNKINFILGDSSEILPNLLNDINDNIIFFLDGHYSSYNTGKGKKDVPLLEELEAINNLCKNDIVIIIDDYRLFGTTYAEDWSEITEKNILSKFDSNKIKSTFILNDRMVLFIGN
jgi:hypothetical protein